MPSLTAAVAFASAAPVFLASAGPSAEVGKCAFKNEPVFPGYFWDPSCQEGVEGCLADGVNMKCRFCGGGSNYSVPCPPSSCHFPNDPFVPYFWDPTCEMGKLGCWADGVHAQCRFCGDHPFTDVKCPEQLSAPANGAKCTFPENEPTTPSFWDPGCQMGLHGCNADGIHVQCRFCGKGVYADIPCPASEVCSFANEPSIPYFWDPNCTLGKLGCMADGMHAECRFCGSGVYEEIQCLNSTVPDSSAGASALTGQSAVATEETQYDAALASQAFMRASSLQSFAQDVSTNASKEGSDGDTMLDGATTVGSSLGVMVALLASVTASAAGSV